uniref:Secreted protein n=1 Tax=Steinernema glaseri TaxID=37863 RepID=A0A1I7Y7X7_9BILA
MLCWTDGAVVCGLFLLLIMTAESFSRELPFALVFYGSRFKLQSAPLAPQAAELIGNQIDLGHRRGLYDSRVVLFASRFGVFSGWNTNPVLDTCQWFRGETVSHGKVVFSFKIFIDISKFLSRKDIETPATN